MERDLAAVAAALANAEFFIAGFEGDEMQEGIGDLLTRIRGALQILGDWKIGEEFPVGQTPNVIKPAITITVEGGCVSDVEMHGLEIDYEIIDLDNLED